MDPLVARPIDRPGIVLVDGSDFFREALRQVLVGEGHRCAAAATLEAAAGDLADPALAVLILDLASSGRAGLAAWRALQSRRPEVRAIVLSARADQDLVLEALRAGASDYLAKPLHEEELRLSLGRALAGYRADVELERLRATVVAEADAAEDDAEADLDLAREICEAVTAGGDADRVLSGVLEALAVRVDAFAAALYLHDAGRGDFERAASFEAGLGRDRERLPAGRGLTGTAVSTGAFVASSEPAGDPRFDAEVDTLVEAPGDPADAALLVLPLRFRGGTVGLVRAFLPAEREPSLRTAEIAGAALSAALRSVLLYRSWRSSIDEVARIRRESAGAPSAWTAPQTPLER